MSGGRPAGPGATLNPVRTLAILAATIALVAVAAPSAPASTAAKPRATFIGDSVAAGLHFAPSAERLLRKGFRLTLDLKVCRRLVQPSCTYRGETPATALDVIRSKGRSLGEAVVIMVGYNDSASSYRSGLDQVMRALRRAGVQDVIWVTLGETRENYRLINGVIRNARSRYRNLTIADWAKLSRGKSWFAGDGLHLEPDGAMALARLVRQKLLAVT